MVLQKANQNDNYSTSTKHWIGIVAMHLLIPLILLTCGWNISWWQGWLYSVVIIVAGIAPRLWLEKKRPELMVERSKFGKAKNIKAWDKVLAPLMAVSISFPPVIVAGLDHNFKWSTEFSTWLNILGFILIVLGYSFSAWAFVENRFFSTVVRIQTDREHKVCDKGPYRIVRHPGYAGNFLALPGLVLALNSVWTVIPLVIALTITIIRTNLEDKSLQEELSGYRDYANRVYYRLIPGVF